MKQNVGDSCSRLGGNSKENGHDIRFNTEQLTLLSTIRTRLQSKIKEVCNEEIADKLLVLYDFCEAAFEDQTRDALDENGNKIPTWCHSADVAEILLDNCSEQLKELPIEERALFIAAAFLHDVPEDTNILQTIPDEKSSYDIFGEIPSPRNLNRGVVEELSLQLEIFSYEDCVRLSNIVNGLTKPSNEQISEFTGLVTKEHDNWIPVKNALQEFFIERFGGTHSVILKVADKLSNLSDLERLDEKRRSKMIKESREFSLPFFESHLTTLDADSGEAKILSTLVDTLNSLLNRYSQ